MHLPEPQRKAYRDVVIQGWAFDPADDKLSLYIPRPLENPDKAIPYHFQTPRGLSSLTEHQALTLLLRFWTRIRILIDLEMINPQLVQSFFKDEFDYERDFCKQLSSAVADELNPSKMVIPRWLEDMKRLEEMFTPNDA
jgi:hypothetical protein